MAAGSGGRVYLLDTTLRDGAQTQGVDFGVPDKRPSPGRWTGSASTTSRAAGRAPIRPTMRFFAKPPPLKRAKFTAFGMTRRAGPQRRQRSRPGGAARLRTRRRSAWSARPGISRSMSRSACSREENIAMIAESVAHVVAQAAARRMFDAEHFFDGYKANPDYALECMQGGLQSRRALDRAVRHQWRHLARMRSSASSAR